MRDKGLFIVIEGTDGSGKTEQFKRLVQKLKEKGHQVETVDFPQYGQPSAYFVEQYLNGSYGGWKEVGPYKGSLFYALDRFAAARQKIEKWLDEGRIVLANRYVASNMGHQGAKIEKRRQRRKFFRWVRELEYEILGIPKPDVNFFLHVPAEIAYELVSGKGEREYLHGKKRDIHEQDIKHLKSAEKSYLEVVNLFPRDFVVVECVKKDKSLRFIDEGRVGLVIEDPAQNGLLSIKEISEEIWRKLTGLYPWL